MDGRYGKLGAGRDGPSVGELVCFRSPTTSASARFTTAPATCFKLKEIASEYG